MLRTAPTIILAFCLSIWATIALPRENSQIINAPIRQINKTGDNIVANQILQIYLQVTESEADAINLVLDGEQKELAKQLLPLLHSMSLEYEEVDVSGLDPVVLADDLLAAAEAILVGENTEAIKVFDDIIAKCPLLIESPTGRYLLRDAFLGRAAVFEMEGDMQASLAILNEGIQKLPDSHDLLSNLARAHAFNGDIDKAKLYLRRSLRWAERDNNTNATIIRWHGDAFQDLFDFEASIEAYKIAEKKHIDAGTTDTKDYAFLVQNLASVLARSGQLTEAHIFYEKAYVLQYQLEISLFNRLQMHNNLALFYLDFGCFEVSLEHALYVLGTEALKVDDPIVLAFVQRTAARSELMLGNLESAAHQHDLAENQLHEVFGQHHWRHAQLLVTSAEINRIGGDLDQALKDISDAMSRLEANDRKPWPIYIQALIEHNLIEHQRGKPISTGTLTDITRKASVLRKYELKKIQWKLDALRFLEWSTDRVGKPPRLESLLETGYSLTYVQNRFLPSSREIISSLGTDIMQSSRILYDRQCEGAIHP